MCVTGHCFWEKTKNGCKDGDDTFKHNAYDFYALCRPENPKEMEFSCTETPGTLDAGECKDRKKETKGFKKESSSEKADTDESEYHDYYYNDKTNDKKYCYDCEQGADTHIM